MNSLVQRLSIGLLVVAVVAVAGVAGVWTAGSRLPAEQTVEMVVATRQGPAAVWRVIADFEGQPNWHAGLAGVRGVEDAAGRPAYEETTSDGKTFTLVTTNWDPPRTLTRELVGDRWVSGSRSFRVAPEGLGTRVKLTVNYQIANPFVRWVEVSVKGLDVAPHRYLRALANHLGDPQNQIERVDGASEP
jgi:hypothetical protein